MKKRPIPDVLTADEQASLLAAMPSSTLLQRRSLAMFRLMLNAGLRSQEVCDLRVRDVQFSSGKMKVRGKGGRQRVLWLRDDDLAFLKAYVEAAAPSGILFQTGPGKKVVTRHLRYVMERLAGRVNLDKRIYCHLMRHTFATDLLKETKNLPLVQKALGHSDIGTTTIYTHIVDEELESAMKNFRNGG